MRTPVNKNRKYRPLITFLCGVASYFILLDIVLWTGARSYSSIIVIGLIFFLFAGATGCTLNPKRPFYAAFVVSIGVFLGIIFHVLIFPNEHDIFPFVTGLAGAVCCFFVAFFWWLAACFYESRKPSLEGSAQISTAIQETASAED
jgi:hypothetical protein